MAKAQDLPLNPAKISGVCNRLLCCLTYEFESYREMKREMPKPGQQINHDGTVYRVTRVLPMQGKVQAVSSEGSEVTLTEEQWRQAKPVDRNAPQARKKGGSKKDFSQKRKKG
jgi:cell fate regulator YaaT (PSP1 superfamily)